MNDRFNFRCGITISHYDDDGDDIETLLLVNDISIFNDGEVGFNRESLKESVKEVVERENLTKEEERTLWNSLDEYEVFEDWYQMPADFIEQCTGLKDKNGNLIYEGDICRIEGTYYDCDYHDYVKVYDIEVIKSLERFFGEAMVKGVYSALGCENLQVEIIGNIHENKELLDER